MGKLSYVIKRARKMDYRAMLKTADMLHKKTGKSRIWLMADMAKCAAKYNAGYVDYKIAEMYRLNDAQRATQITRGISNNIVARMNDKKFWHFFDNKPEFNQLFHEQVKREWLNFSTATEEQFAEFVQGRGDIICKPIRIFLQNLMHLPDRKTTRHFPNVTVLYANDEREAENLMLDAWEHGFQILSRQEDNGKTMDRLAVLLDEKYYYDENRYLRSQAHTVHTLFYRLNGAKEKLMIVVKENAPVYERVLELL